MHDADGARGWPDERGDPKWPIVLGFAAIGLVLALETRGRCEPDPSFPSNSRAALPSHLCRTMHLFPGSFTSAFLLCVAYLAPAVAVLAGFIGATKYPRKGILWLGIVFGGFLLLVEAILMTKAHLGYRGA